MKNGPQGYILCGGQSRRFGTDKARFVLDGKPMIERLAGLLTQVSSSVTAVADVAGKYADLGIPTIADQIPAAGPLAGLHAALQHAGNTSQNTRILILSCDMTALNPSWIDELNEHVNNGTQIVLYEEQPSEGTSRAHPFPGLYHVSLLPLIETQLETGKRSFQKFFDAVGTSCVRLPLPDDWPLIPQINTPEDLDRWKSQRIT